MSNIYRVFKYLSENNITANDVIKQAGIKMPTFYKYMNLFKQAGFKIIKSNKIYKPVFYFDMIQLSDAESGLIAYLLFLSQALLSKYKNRIFLKMVDKMLKLTNFKTETLVYEKYERLKNSFNMNLYQKKIELFERCKNNNFEITLTLKNGEKMTLYPQDVIYKNKKVYFNFLDNQSHEIRQIDINKITQLTPKVKTPCFNCDAKEIFFELYGRLSKIYKLKEGERIVEISSDKLTVANNASDKNFLFRRLLRYDTLCKVKFPQKDAIAFKKIIEKSLDNIDIIKDNINKEVIN